MKNVILAASAVAVLSTMAAADITVNIGNALLNGNESVSATTLTGVTGTLTGFVINYDFVSPGEDSGSWASDAELVINGSNWGGYDVDFLGSSNVHVWSFDGFGSADTGHYTDTRSDIPVSLANPTTIDLAFGNGWGDAGPVQYNNITVTLVGVSVPTPGAAAVLGLGGLALGRRRR